MLRANALQVHLSKPLPDRLRPSRGFGGSVVLATRLVSPNYREQEVPALDAVLALAEPLRARQPATGAGSLPEREEPHADPEGRARRR